MFVVDTNILVYAANKDCIEHEPCYALLHSLRTEPTAWYITWGILYEFLRVITHPRVLEQPWSTAQALSFVSSCLASSSLNILAETSRHLKVADEIFRTLPLLSGNLVYDARTAILMKENGLSKIYTRNTDFHRFPFINVVDPLIN